jgi:SET domain-containing protein
MASRSLEKSKPVIRRHQLNAGEGGRLSYQDGLVPDYYMSPAIKVEKIKGKGLGVVATGNILKSEIIECCPVIVLSPDKKLDTVWKHLHEVMLETMFSRHHFWWTARHGALALGYGSLYNHSSEPNADIVKYIKQRKMVFLANQNIPEDDEITICYRCVWFDVVDGTKTSS